MKGISIKNLWHFSSSVFIVVMWGLAGGYIFGSFGLFFSTYFLPPWTQVEIDTRGRDIDDIVAVDITRRGYVDDWEFEIIFKTIDGEFFSYSSDNWQMVDATEFENGGRFFQTSPDACFEFDKMPPVILLQSVKQTVSVHSWDSAYEVKYYCYVLRKDGTLNEWVRGYTIEYMFCVGAFFAVVGFLIGGLIGRRMLRRKIFELADGQ